MATGEMATGEFTPSPQTTARRDDRASLDRAAAYAVLDEGLVAHVGFVIDGRPFVIPMAYGRDGDRLLLHGSVATRLTRALAGGAPVCVTVTLLDGLVVARSQFHHSMNYRSVVVVGEARRVTDHDEVAAALELIVDHIIPGRAAEARTGNRVEVRQTMVIGIPLETASLKARTGGPVEAEEDLIPGSWGGVIPLSVTVGTPQPDDDSDGAAVPPSVDSFRR